ncbi:MAG: hypothetical protein JXR96_30785 [Deltaproteobacteria bacterium]|nr:hypothetical protein [Deltaproteobacteria bacterium]
MSHTRPISPRTLRLGLVLGLALAACSSGVIRFSPEQDAAIMLELESVFETSATSAGGPRLALCENRELSDAWDSPGGCQQAHVVRGGGRGIAHMEDGVGFGCGGCPFGVVAFVRGTWTGEPFAEPVELQGSVGMGDLYDAGEIFSYPYRFYLQCKGEIPACASIDGELDQTGELRLSVHFDQTDVGHYVLQAGGQAECPAL